MPKAVTSVALTKCSYGLAPSVLNVLPISGCSAGFMPLADINTMIPIVNILPFGLCNSPLNATIIAAQAATPPFKPPPPVTLPMPCMPIPLGPWSPGSKVTVNGTPLLTDGCKCNCVWGGSIEITTSPLSMFLDVP